LEESVGRRLAIPAQPAKAGLLSGWDPLLFPSKSFSSQPSSRRVGLPCRYALPTSLFTTEADQSTRRVGFSSKRSRHWVRNYRGRQLWTRRFNTQHEASLYAHRPAQLLRSSVGARLASNFHLQLAEKRAVLVAFLTNFAQDRTRIASGIYSICIFLSTRARIHRRSLIFRSKATQLMEHAGLCISFIRKRVWHS
jgi:hypothetical protein